MRTPRSLDRLTAREVTIQYLKPFHQDPQNASAQERPQFIKIRRVNVALIRPVILTPCPDDFPQTKPMSGVVALRPLRKGTLRPEALGRHEADLDEAVSKVGVHAEGRLARVFQGDPYAPPFDRLMHLQVAHC